MGNLCLNGGIPWLFKAEGSLCFISKENTETIYHHFIECPHFRDNYSSLWSNLKTKIINFNQTDGITMSDFITNLDPHKKVLLLLGRPFLSNVLVSQLAHQSLRLAHHFLKNSSTSGPDCPLNLFKITWSSLWGNHVSQQ